MLISRGVTLIITGRGPPSPFVVFGELHTQIKKPLSLEVQEVQSSSLRSLLISSGTETGGQIIADFFLGGIRILHNLTFFDVFKKQDLLDSVVFFVFHMCFLSSRHG